MSEPQASEEDVRDGRIGRILNEYLDRRARGQAEPEAELLAKHPDLADHLRSHLEMLRELAPDRSKIDALVAQEVLQKSADPRYTAEFGPYKITGWIGRGGMGIVLEAYEESLNRTVALKILKPELVEDEAAVARFSREAKAAAGLHHPNIITVHAVGQERDAHFLAMEYIDGPTLGQLIRQKGPLPTETIRRFFGEILSALACAHEAGLIHRDIKSSNILLDEPRTSARADVRHGQAPLGRAEQPSPSTTGKDQPACQSTCSLPMPPDDTLNSELATLNSCTVKLADFGLARMLSAWTRMTTTGSVLGTPEYMSPEQARGEAELDHRTDLYSAGVVLYEMLTGRTPFKADTPSAVIHRILHEEPTHPRTISREADAHLASLALRLMAKKPEDRFDSATESSAALEGGERVHSLEKRRRLRGHILVGVLVLVLLAAGTATLNRLARQSAPSGIAPEVKPPITRVWVDENLPTRILGEYGDDPTPRILYDFPPEVIRVTDTELVDPDGSGQAIVVAGTTRPLSGACLFVFSAGAGEPSPMNLSSDMRWPDCPTPLQFRCLDLATGDLDGEPGDEIVAAAGDMRYYPTRVSIIDPRTKRIGPTFWHMGRLTHVRILPGFFDGARPAILARGMNNKLDGFDDRLRPGEEQLAHWDLVPVVMILDPNDMDGLGPPPTDRLPGFSTAHVYAYAFLDLAYTPKMPLARDEAATNGRTSPPQSVLQETGDIQRVELAPVRVANGTGPWFELLIVGFEKPGEELGRAYLTVDRDLQLRRVEAVNETRDPLAAKEAYWKELWQPIIQNGEYVGTP